jgi:hypothetical protein
MAVLTMFADVLQEHHTGKKTGALFVSVAEASENLIRFYFQEGTIYSISFGTARDRECLDIIDCYNLGKAVYFDGMKIASSSRNLPETPEIIAAIRAAGKQVQMDR